jgi:hypothetical protein
MTDAKLITYCESIHISMDSADLIAELVYRVRRLKSQLYEATYEHNGAGNALAKAGQNADRPTECDQRQP